MAISRWWQYRLWRAGTENPVALLDLATTWNNAPTIFRGIRLNVTNTASGADSLLMDLQTGGATQLSLTPSGQLNLAGALQFIGNAQIGSTGVNDVYITANQMRFGGPGDVALVREGGGQLALRRAANSQTFRLYNTFTDTNNYERGIFSWVSNALRIGTEHAGAGVARPLSFFTNGLERMRIAADGALTYGIQSTWEPPLEAVTVEMFEVASGIGHISLMTRDHSGDGFPNASLVMNPEEGILLSAFNISLTAPGGSVDVSQWKVSPTSIRPPTDTTTIGTVATGAYYPIDTANINNIFLHNSYTNSTNWERGHVRWVANALEFSTERNGSGLARPIIFRTNTVNRFMIGAAGTIQAQLAASQNFIITGLPTVNPNVAGALWNDGGTLKVSAG